MIGYKNFGACHAPGLKQNRKGWRAEMAETVMPAGGESSRWKACECLGRSGTLACRSGGDLLSREASDRKPPAGHAPPEGASHTRRLEPTPDDALRSREAYPSQRSLWQGLTATRIVLPGSPRASHRFTPTRCHIVPPAPRGKRSHLIDRRLTGLSQADPSGRGAW